MARTYGLALAAVVAANFFWAGNYEFGGAAATSMPILSLMFMKWGVAVVPLILITHFVERPQWREVLRHWKFLLVLSMLGIVGYGFMLYESLMTTSGYEASVINAFNPVLIALAAAVLLRERITRLSYGGIVLALLGVLYALYDGHLSLMFTEGFSHGALWMFGVVIAWTSYTLIIRRTPDIPPLTATTIQVAFAVIVMTPFVIATGGITLPNTSAGAWSLAYIAIFPSIVAYILYNFGSKELPPVQVGVLLNLMTLFVAIIATVMGTPPGSAGVVGGILVIAGVAMVTAQKNKPNSGAASAHRKKDSTTPVEAEPG
ncbi:DMT family transporter [Rhodococcus sp. NPDC057529]|uniref:DMT family transporter n=1 Tax=Rhodococcus sp. NPDC057529 TaxID=3346158 RepID=UPI00366D91CF